MTIHINSFIQNEFNLANRKMGRLLDLLNARGLLSYEKGIRNIDHVIREKIAALTGEIDSYYRTVKSFTTGKTASKHLFEDILNFFIEDFVMNDKPAEYLAALTKEIDDQQRDSKDPQGSGKFIRRENQLLMELSADILKWERIYYNEITPGLKEFLVDINEILLFYMLDEVIARLIMKNEFNQQNSSDYFEFKNSIIGFAEYHIMVTRLVPVGTNIEDLINQTLQRMGFREQILKTSNISAEKYREMISEIIKEGNFSEFAKRFTPAAAAALDAIKKLEEKR